MRSVTNMVFSLSLTAMILSCQSTERGRDPGTRAADAAVGAVAAVAGVPALGAGHGGPRYDTVVEVQITGGLTCATIAPRDLALRLTDETSQEILLHGVGMTKDWFFVSDARLLTGPYRFEIFNSRSTKTLALTTRRFAGESRWKVVMTLPCGT